MKTNNVKEEFRKDFEENFYQFDGEQTLENIKAEIAHQNMPFRDNKVQYKRNDFALYVKAFVVVLFVVLTLFLTRILDSQNKYTDVDRLFKKADVEYVAEPILVCSSYLGEELRIYMALNNKNSETEVEYYYYYNQTSKVDVSHLLFINNDKDIKKTIDKDNNFGSLSKLLKINPADNIEVVLVYGDEQSYSQFFIAE